MKVLNLYAGIGGNRKLWGGDIEVTAVEYRKDIAQVYIDHFPNDTVIIGDAHQYLLGHYHEFDFIWSSRPCQTHSRARFWGHKNSDGVEKKFPDFGLYEEIVFLQHYFDGLWVVENVNPFYEPLIKPTIQMGRHIFWSNFKIMPTEIKEADIKNDTNAELKRVHGFDLSGYKFESRKDQIYRNCVHPETGLHILNCARGIIEQSKSTQTELF